MKTSVAAPLGKLGGFRQRLGVPRQRRVPPHRHAERFVIHDVERPVSYFHDSGTLNPVGLTIGNCPIATQNAVNDHRPPTFDVQMQ